MITMVAMITINDNNDSNNNNDNNGYVTKCRCSLPCISLNKALTCSDNKLDPSLSRPTLTFKPVKLASLIYGVLKSLHE